MTVIGMSCSEATHTFLMMPWWLHSSGWEAGATLFFALAIGHALGDFPLQSEFLARGKDRHAKRTYPDTPPASLWAYCLTAHALTHAGLVWAITGSAVLGFIEFLLHWSIDFSKSEKWLGFHADQAAHLLCKLGYAIYLTQMA
jgi:hypothetical protein